MKSCELRILFRITCHQDTVLAPFFFEFVWCFLRVRFFFYRCWIEDTVFSVCMAACFFTLIWFLTSFIFTYKFYLDWACKQEVESKSLSWFVQFKWNMYKCNHIHRCTTCTLLEAKVSYFAFPLPGKEKMATEETKKHKTICIYV